MTANPKRPAPLRDPAYLRAVAEMPCILTGKTPCEAAHLRHGVHAMGVKPGDDLTLPLAVHLHREQHAIGERHFWRFHMTDDLMMGALQALAREWYRQWKEANK